MNVKDTAFLQFWLMYDEHMNEHARLALRHVHHFSRPISHPQDTMRGTESDATGLSVSLGITCCHWTPSPYQLAASFLDCLTIPAQQNILDSMDLNSCRSWGKLCSWKIANEVDFIFCYQKITKAVQWYIFLSASYSLNTNTSTAYEMSSRASISLNKSKFGHSENFKSRKAARLPILNMADIVSHPVIAWGTRNFYSH